MFTWLTAATATADFRLGDISLRYGRERRIWRLLLGDRRCCRFRASSKTS